LVFLLLVGASACGGGGGNSGGDRGAAPAAIDVPDVTGQATIQATATFQGTAESTLSEAGLSVGTVTSQSSETVPAGYVISQSPVPCTACAASGDAVDLVVSSGTGGGPTTVTVGGNVAGLNGTVVLRNNDADDLSVPGDGSFTFATTVDSGTAYSVTILSQPTGQTCAVLNGSGTANTNVTQVVVSCSDIPMAQAGYGDKRVLFAHVKFSDTVNDPFPISDTETRAAAIRSFFGEISYGASTQTFDIKPWIALPNPANFYQTEDQFGDTLAAAAADLVQNSYDLTGVDIVALLLTPLELGFPGCSEVRRTLSVGGEVKLVPVATLSGNDFTCKDADITSHEIGHGYGLPNDVNGFLHSSMFACRTWPNKVPPTLTDPTFNETDCDSKSGDPAATFFPYGQYDFMGGYRGHPNVFQKRQAGWIGGGQITQLVSSGTATLDALELPSPGTKAIQVPLGTDQSGQSVNYWVEYRSQKPTSLESPETIPTGAPDRVLVWVNLPDVPSEGVQEGNSIIAQSRVYTFWDFALEEEPSVTALSVGQSFTDPYRGVRVTRDTNPDGLVPAASVSVSKSNLDISPPIGAVLVTGTTQDISVTNNGTEAVTQGPLALQGRNPTSFQIISDGCGNVEIGPGQSCQISVTHLREPSDFAKKFATLEWTSSDPLRSLPSVGLVGTP
jgi:hypothetical protein